MQPGQDFYGTSGDDLYYAPITTVNFINGNTLNSGDRLDGNGGTNTLQAELINDAFVSGVFGGSMGAVRPTTQNIQNVEINAILTSDVFFEFEEEFFPVTLDAARMYDVEHIGSYDSNASLVIRDLTTKTSDGGVRNTEDITIRMDHTANKNTGEKASDLKVYFDNNYLLSGQQEFPAEIRYELMDQTAVDAGRPPLDLFALDSLRFVVDGVDYEIDNGDGLLPAGTPGTVGWTPGTYAQLVDHLNALLANQFPDLDDVFFQLGDQFQDPDGRVGTQVVLTGAAGVELPADITFPFQSIGFGNSPSDNIFRGVEFVDAPPPRDEPVTSNIELHKVGRGSEGGDLIVGGKSQSESSTGIEVFNIHVLGDASKPSDLGVVNSTNGTLSEVYISTHEDFLGGDSFADLTIRDLGGEKLNGVGTIASADVQIMDARDFLGNLTLTTTLDESGNGEHQYWLGNGDNVLTIEMDGFGGIAGDSLMVVGGTGDDEVNVSGEADLEHLT